MRRLVDGYLEEWRNRRRRKPLLVRGARQVGKTYSVTRFGEKKFDNVVVANLERNRALHAIFERDLDPARIVKELEVVLDVRILAGSTLLFFDEIQACPKALTALKYFREELPGMHVAAAGSLLEFALGDVSFPVGQLNILEMYPMTFAEFLWAGGADEAAAVVLAGPAGTGQAVHESLLAKLRYYFMVGGMPEAVSAYVNTDSINEARGVHAELVETYRQDFSKYAPRADKGCLDDVLHQVARNVGSQIKYARLSSRFSQPTIRKAFELLCTAGLMRRVPHASPAGLPLASSESGKVFKAVLVDIGILHSLCGMPLATDPGPSGLLSAYRGSIAEQFVGQEMLAARGVLNYWSRRARSSSAEVDYLAAIDGEVCPVEVKSGPAGKLKSMQLCLDEYPNCPRGVVMSLASWRELPDHRLLFVPLYLAHALASGRLELRCAVGQGDGTSAAARK